MKNNAFIKNTLFFLIVSLSIFALSACGQNSNSTTTSDNAVPNDTNTVGAVSVDVTDTTNSIETSETHLPQSETDDTSEKIDENMIDIEKVEAVIADDCNSVFEGKIGTQNIYMAIYREGDLLTAAYITQAEQEHEISLQGTIETGTASFVLNSSEGATFMGTIEPETERGTMLEGTYMTTNNGEETKFQLMLSHTLGNTYESRYPLTSAKTEEIEAFASQVKFYVTENDKAGLANLISYPIEVSIKGSRVSIDNKEEFEQKYDDIINTEFKEKISNCYTKYLFSNYMGIMLGNGEIWFENLNNSGLQIYAINN